MVKGGTSTDHQHLTGSSFPFNAIHQPEPRSRSQHLPGCVFERGATPSLIPRRMIRSKTSGIGLMSPPPWGRSSPGDSSRCLHLSIDSRDEKPVHFHRYTVEDRSPPVRDRVSSSHHRRGSHESRIPDTIPEVVFCLVLSPGIMVSTSVRAVTRNLLFGISNLFPAAPGTFYIRAVIYHFNSILGAGSSIRIHFLSAILFALYDLIKN